MKHINLLFFILILCSGVYTPIEAREYVVGEADVLKVTVYEHEDLTSTVRVSREGTITFPLIGKVEVLGLTLREIEEKLTTRLADGYIVNPQVSIFIEDFRSRVFYVTGEVKKPDAYKFEDDTTVIKAITIAGGFTDLAAKNRIKILRKNNGQEETIEGVRIDAPIQPDDVVVVPESFF